MSEQFSTGFPRYNITMSAGSRRVGNLILRHAIYDRRERKIVSFHATFKQAQIAVKKLNRKVDSSD